MVHTRVRTAGSLHILAVAIERGSFSELQPHTQPARWLSRPQRKVDVWHDVLGP